MTERILLSGVGSTDPVRDCYDGPLLHIVRHMRPEKVYLFLTEEMDNRNRLDNRYERAVRRIAPGTEVIRHRTGIREAHLFDEYREPVREIFERIEREHPEADLLVNMSSGTLQYISTLALYIASGKGSYKPIQVASPAKGPNRSQVVWREYDLEEALENNLDDLGEETECRILTPDLLSFRRTLLKRQMGTFIGNYEYESARNLLADISVEGVDRLVRLLKYGEEKLLLKEDAERCLDREALEAIAVPSEKRYRRLVEYYLAMDIRRRKGKVNELLLMLNPFFTEIQEQYLRKVRRIHPDRIMEWNGWQYTVDPEKLRAYDKALYNKLEKAFNGLSERAANMRFYDEIIGHVVDENDSDADFRVLSANVCALNKLRNQAAHQLKAFEEKDVRDCIGIGIEKIMENLKRALFKIYGGDCRQKHFEVFDLLNQMIEKEMEQVL